METTAKKMYSLEHPNGIAIEPVLIKKPKRKSMALWRDDHEKKAIETTVGLEKIYHKYFTSTGCRLFVDLSVNNWSVADALFLSGNSKMVLVEYKKRYVTSFQYYTAILERDKYDALMTAGRLLNAPVLYINEWADGIITIWQLSHDDKYKWETQICQHEDGGSRREEKQITYLLFNKANYIISMKSWESVLWPALENYFKSKRGE